MGAGSFSDGELGEVIVVEWLGLQLMFVELVPSLGRIDAEALEGVWIPHFGFYQLTLSFFFFNDGRGKEKITD